MSAPTLACVIVASAARKALVHDVVLPSATGPTQFDEVVLVGDWPQDTNYLGCRYLCVAPLTHSTTDALVKRDVGTLATTADIVVYLCDDHKLAPGFADAVRAVADEPWDVLVPNRYTERFERIPLNNGEHAGYCGGHGGVFRRALVRALPWSAGPHDRLWDLHMSCVQRALGATFVWYPRADIAIVDVEPDATPWK